MKLKEVIVVEGKNDSLRLKQFFDVDTIETHGLGMDEKKLVQLAALHKQRGLILFLDPDSAGNRIRQRINDYIPAVKNAFIDKKKARTTSKVGIEHASKEDLEHALQHLLSYDERLSNTLSYEEYLTLGFSGQAQSKSLRAYVGNQLFIGECNAKTLFKRLNMYQIEYATLQRIVEEYYE